MVYIEILALLCLVEGWIAAVERGFDFNHETTFMPFDKPLMVTAHTYGVMGIDTLTANVSFSIPVIGCVCISIKFHLLCLGRLCLHRARSVSLL